MEEVVPVRPDQCVLTLDQHPTLIMDRGIAPSADLELIKEAQYEYTVIERAPTEKEYDAEYKIETNKANMSAIDIWQDYITLTRVESAFRDLKSELGLRPVYHKNTVRT